MSPLIARCSMFMLRFCHGVAVYTCSITLRVVTLPSTTFEGTTSATFEAFDFGKDSTSITPKTVTRGELASAKAEKETLDESSSYHSSTSAQKAQLAPGTLSEPQNLSDTSLDDTRGLGSNAKAYVAFKVTFYHCNIGEVWNSSAPSLDDSDEDTPGSCQTCIDVVEGSSEVCCVTRGVVSVPADTYLLTDPLTEGTTKYLVPKRVFFNRRRRILMGLCIPFSLCC